MSFGNNNHARIKLILRYWYCITPFAKFVVIKNLRICPRTEVKKPGFTYSYYNYLSNFVGHSLHDPIQIFHHFGVYARPVGPPAAVAPARESHEGMPSSVIGDLADQRPSGVTLTGVHAPGEVAGTNHPGSELVRAVDIGLDALGGR